MDKYVIAYELDSQGKYKDKLFLRDEFKNIASFIAQTKAYNIVITDDADTLILDTIGCFLNYAPNKYYANPIRTFLAQFQFDNEPLPPIEYIEVKYD